MKIWLDMCHGVGQDKGASKIANEEIESDKLTSIVKSKLESLGHTVNRTRPTNPNHTEISSCKERAQNANNWGADLFISNHNNAGGGEGAEVYTYNGEQTLIAKRYLQYILKHGGKTHDGTLTHNSVSGAIKHHNGLIVIRETNMEAILLENFYVDTQSDYDFYKNNIEMFANAIVYGITGVDLGRNKKPQLVDKLNKNELQVTADVLNVRNSPNGSVIGQVQQGEKYKINKQQNNWFEIFWGNSGGWVSGNYVKTEFGKENNKKEVYDMKKIVLYSGDLDALSAVIVAQKNQCPMMKKSDFINSGLKAEKIIQIGGKTGSNRYTSFKDAASLV